MIPPGQHQPSSASRSASTQVSGEEQSAKYLSAPRTHIAMIHSTINFHCLCWHGTGLCLRLTHLKHSKQTFLIRPLDWLPSTLRNIICYQTHLVSGSHPACILTKLFVDTFYLQRPLCVCSLAATSLLRISRTICFPSLYCHEAEAAPGAVMFPRHLVTLIIWMSV